ncbi:MAG: hypothetical protein IKE24_00435 [Clostridia bacterium]|nr:hypothetical protein [Clostridia bacterium]
MKTPINARTLRQHLTYSWWKYALVIALGAVAVNLYYTMTAYRSPAEKKVEMYVYGVVNQDALDGYMANVRENKMSDMEEMHSLALSTDDTYGVMQLSTYVAAAEGDLYVLPRNNFVSMAASGAWSPLEGDEELMALLNEAGVNLQSGWRRESSTGENHLFGIPLSALPGLNDYLYVENGFLSVLVSNGNDENVALFLRILCEDMIPVKTGE